MESIEKNDISDDEAMRILNDMTWNDNRKNDEEIYEENDENDNKDSRLNDFIHNDDIISILESIKNEKVNNNINTIIDGNKKIFIKDKNVEFQIDVETLMKWNAACASYKENDDDDDNNNVTDFNNFNDKLIPYFTYII